MSCSSLLWIFILFVGISLGELRKRLVAIKSTLMAVQLLLQRVLPLKAVVSPSSLRTTATPHRLP